MVSGMEFPVRKRQRLKGYDYSSPGCYFVTILTNKRQKLFWDDYELNAIGKIVENRILTLSQFFNFIKIDNYVIMPDHIHLLITIGCDSLPDSDEWLLADIKNKIEYPDLKNIIGSFKSFVSRDIHKIIPNIKVWHKSYYDHIINNKKDYDETWDYIEANPIRWKIKQEYTYKNR